MRRQTGRGWGPVVLVKRGLMGVLQRIDPEFAAAYVNRGFAYHNQGDYERAIDDHRHYLELQPDAAGREAVEARIAELEAQLTPPE